jgi:hypothetical protein
MSKSAKRAPRLEILEPLIDQLIAGTADTKAVARKLESLGFPTITDQTEQLRLALSLLECHDDVSGKVSGKTDRRSASMRASRPVDSSV